MSITEARARELIEELVNALPELLDALSAALPVPPTTDDREALAEAYRASTGWGMSEGAAVVDAFIAGFDAAALPVPPTEEQIEAAKRAVWNSGAQYHSNMAMCEKYARAALEAAARVGGEA